MKRGVLVLCCFLGACGESGPPTPGVPVAFSAACDKANDGKRISLEGYLEFPDSFKADDETVMLRVRPSIESYATVVGASARIGTGANNVELPPKSFKRSDLKIHLGDGRVLGYHDKIKVSGAMYFPSSIARVEFKCGLTNTLYEAAAQ